MRQFPSGGGFAKISVGGGAEPRWNKTGSELYFTRTGEQDRELIAVATHVDGRGELQAESPKTLFNYSTFVYVIESNMWTYSPHPDGNKFFLATQAKAVPTLDIITNWARLAKK